MSGTGNRTNSASIECHDATEWQRRFRALVDEYGEVLRERDALRSHLEALKGHGVYAIDEEMGIQHRTLQERFQQLRIQAYMDAVEGWAEAVVDRRPTLRQTHEALGRLSSTIFRTLSNPWRQRVPSPKETNDLAVLCGRLISDHFGVFHRVPEQLAQETLSPLIQETAAVLRGMAEVSPPAVLFVADAGEGIDMEWHEVLAGYSLEAGDHVLRTLFPGYYLPGRQPRVVVRAVVIPGNPSTSNAIQAPCRGPWSAFRMTGQRLLMGAMLLLGGYGLARTLGPRLSESAATTKPLAAPRIVVDAHARMLPDGWREVQSAMDELLRADPDCHLARHLGAIAAAIGGTDRSAQVFDPAVRKEVTACHEWATTRQRTSLQAALEEGCQFPHVASGLLASDSEDAKSMVSIAVRVRQVKENWVRERLIQDWTRISAKFQSRGRLDDGYVRAVRGTAEQMRSSTTSLATRVLIEEAIVECGGGNQISIPSNSGFGAYLAARIAHREGRDAECLYYVTQALQDTGWRNDNRLLNTFEILKDCIARNSLAHQDLERQFGTVEQVIGQFREMSSRGRCWLAIGVLLNSGQDQDGLAAEAATRAIGANPHSDAARELLREIEYRRCSKSGMAR